MARELFAVLLLMFGINASVFADLPTRPLDAPHSETGIATYYAGRFEGRRTASGETFRNANLTAAHPSLPFGTVVRVSSAKGHSVIVRIADRGPSGRQQRRGTIIDLSQSAAAQLRMLRAGRLAVSVQVLEWGRGAQRPGLPVEHVVSSPESVDRAAYASRSSPSSGAF